MAGSDDRKSPPTDSVPPPPQVREPRDYRDTRLPLEKVLPELLKRGLSAGRDVSESIFPRELASSLVSQLGDARIGLVNAIADEFGRFLRQADIASEVRKVLAGLNVEAKVQLRFSEDDSGKLRPRVEIENASASSTRRKSTPPEEEDE
jgi:hypothetical protein